MKNKKIKLNTAILAVIGVLVLSVGGTLAYLQTSSHAISNLFNHGVINVTVEEEFDGGEITEAGVTKKVKIKNDSLDGQLSVAPCYVRVNLVATWVNDDGSVAAVNADSLIDYKFTEYADDAEAKWVKGDDGYYYYTGLLDKDEETGTLIEEVALKAGVEKPSTGHLEINVLTDGVQKAKVTDERVWGNPTADGVCIYQ